MSAAGDVGGQRYDRSRERVNDQRKLFRRSVQVRRETGRWRRVGSYRGEDS